MVLLPRIRLIQILSITLTSLLLTFCFVTGNQVAFGKTHKHFNAEEKKFLIQTFKKSGFNEKFLKTIFNNRALKKSEIIIQKNVINDDRAEFYRSFLSPYSINIAYRFSKKWRTALRQASNKYQVDQEVLTAILLVETGLGNVLGRYGIINVFSSILVADFQQNKKNTINYTLPPEQLNHRERLRQKAEWAHDELEALLLISIKTGKNVNSIRGSFAGAFGIPQFLPSSYLKWGIDSDKNGVINLFFFPDAIHSTANYLKSHGWKKGLYLESNKDVVWQYNHSQNYVDAVLAVAGKLRQFHQQKIASFKEKKIRSRTI